jgi:hypothetical protein
VHYYRADIAERTADSGQAASSRAAFESALVASPDHLGARQELDAIARPKR